MKGIYDQLYRLEELYQKFPEEEQHEVKQMIDPTRYVPQSPPSSLNT